jgi:hypothetical protein
MVYQWRPPEDLKKSKWWQSSLKVFSFLISCLAVLFLILCIYPYCEAVQSLFLGVPLNKFLQVVNGWSLIPKIGYGAMILAGGILLGVVTNGLILIDLILSNDPKFLKSVLSSAQSAEYMEVDSNDDPLTQGIKEKINKLPWKLLIKLQNYGKGALLFDFLINYETYPVVPGWLGSWIWSAVTGGWGNWDYGNASKLLVAALGVEIIFLIWRFFQDLIDQFGEEAK